MNGQIIRCMNDLCGFNEMQKCSIDFISLNELGICDECIVPNIPLDDLNRYKNELLREYECFDKQTIELIKRKNAED